LFAVFFVVPQLDRCELNPLDIGEDSIFVGVAFTVIMCEATPNGGHRDALLGEAP
jgi:hypothetical protein